MGRQQQHESGMIAEYMSVLKVVEVDKLRGLMKGILKGADMHKE